MTKAEMRRDCEEEFGWQSGFNASRAIQKIQARIRRSSLLCYPKLALNTILAAFLIGQSGYFEPWGKDAGLKPAVTDVGQKKEPSWAVQLSDAIIHFHQEVISPVDGPRSHYRPSSSQYMQQAMHNYGFIRGFIMGCDRLLRENDEEWVYRTTYYEGKPYKYDPPKQDKYE